MASKGRIFALTHHGMAINLGQHRPRVNAISPCLIETRDWQDSPRAQMPVHSEQDRLQHSSAASADIAQVCLLLTEHADFMTGQNITIDGGMTVKMI